MNIYIFSIFVFTRICEHEFVCSHLLLLDFGCTVPERSFNRRVDAASTLALVLLVIGSITLSYPCNNGRTNTAGE